MTIGEKIKVLRTLKGFSQEKVSEMLGMSITGYQKIERGDTDVNFSRLEQIVKTLDSNMLDLFSIGEKNIFYVQGNSNNDVVGGLVINNKSNTEILFQQRIEKLESEFSLLKELFLKKTKE